MDNFILRANDICWGNLILVNSSFPMLGKELSDLTEVNDSGIKLCREAAIKLDSAMRKINGWSGITPVSGYRSFDEQQNIWNDCIEESGIDFTQKYVAKPAYSEHQTGLAIDLGRTRQYIDFVRPEFPDDGVCGGFKSIAAEFGFILRYPLGKEHITKIAYEPWHFRYVGVPHAEIILKNGFVLEEYIEFLKQFKYPNKPLNYKNAEMAFEISYLATGNYSLEINEPFRVSGNNSDGFIVTKWGK